MQVEQGLCLPLRHLLSTTSVWLPLSWYYRTRIGTVLCSPMRFNPVRKPCTRTVYRRLSGVQYTANVRWPRDVHHVEFGVAGSGGDRIGCNIPPHVFSTVSTTRTLGKQEQEIIKVHHTSSMNRHQSRYPSQTHVSVVWANDTEVQRAFVDLWSFGYSTAYTAVIKGRRLSKHHDARLSLIPLVSCGTIEPL
jgi:hypothetical protein